MKFYRLATDNRQARGNKQTDDSQEASVVAATNELKLGPATPNLKKFNRIDGYY